MIVGRMVTFFVDQMVLGRGRWGERNVWDERLGTTSVRNFNTIKGFRIANYFIFYTRHIFNTSVILFSPDTFSAQGLRVGKTSGRLISSLESD
jgi:hypothetical protein